MGFELHNRTIFNVYSSEIGNFLKHDLKVITFYSIILFYIVFVDSLQFERFEQW